MKNAQLPMINGENSSFFIGNCSFFILNLIGRIRHWAPGTRHLWSDRAIDVESTILIRGAGCLVPGTSLEIDAQLAVARAVKLDEIDALPAAQGQAARFVWDGEG